MSDDFLLEAKAAWRREQPDVAAIRLRLRRTRWAAHAVLTIEAIGGLLGFAVGVYFFALASRTHELLYTLSALMMLVGMPLTMTASIRARRPSLRWEDETPRDVVVTALRRAEATLQSIRIGRWGVAAICVFVVALWLVQAGGAIRAAGFLRLYTAATIAICVPYWLYLRHRFGRASRERTSCLRLLAELEQADAASEQILRQDAEK